MSLNDGKEIIEFGDYQTPEWFVNEICLYLKNQLNINPKYIFEPTFGIGNFIKGSIRIFNNVKNIFGVEIKEKYYNIANAEINKMITDDKKIELFNDNIFTFNFDKIKSKIEPEDELLIIGNPPWVTNSNLSLINSNNLPAKKNFKGFSGIEAITGKSNFDIAEYIILRLLGEFRHYNCYIAMLCKSIVVRNIVRDLKIFDFSLSDIKALNFNAKQIFNVNAEACLLIMKVGNTNKLTCDVYNFDNPGKKIKEFGWIDDNFISDINSYFKDIDGVCQFEWRQGIKHDCSKVMELTWNKKENKFFNKLNEIVDIETDYVYPLIKSSDIKQYVIRDVEKYIILTQKKVREDTSIIKNTSPKLWCYLQKHSYLLDNRKSSVYKNSPRFSIFGVGDYSFKPYKVVVSGFYKAPLFALAYNNNDKPIMVDDTCYFLGFDDYNYALITTLLLNSDIVINFLKSIAFMEAKRPFTKEVLMRIDILKVAENITFEYLLNIAEKLQIEHQLCYESYNKYLNYLQELSAPKGVGMKSTTNNYIFQF